ncbi:hypothetical protein J8J14_17100 [Roseomonas sp. SSH11]|uniref:Uncharacterized protein n=1 Tax=Pararoseomonas baculiformis TaxID=2820812 RepID=A0ABS4AHM2_9PROT|nr:DUF6525 family protein [Pararoseomonas baculiformis]MBP0446495.1 hypothetical protein [Pararoseomonas baculiformis]
MPRLTNDNTARDECWFRHAGDEWASYDSLPAPIRRRMQDHAYDPWAVNMVKLWRLFRRRHASSARAERTLIHHMERLEALEREAFSSAYRRAHGAPLPHLAAGASVLRRRA